MPAPWEEMLVRWQAAGFIDPDAAARIREFESRESKPAGLRWPAIAAIVFGAIMLSAGVLLFVSAHWDEIAPSTRFTIVVLMVAGFHAAGAYASKIDVLSMALHGVGTASLGAGIYLSGQIFNMAAHWPSAILMWAVGAWIAWALRRDWVQLSFAAILTPAWIGSEWVDAFPQGDQVVARVLCTGMLLLAITYFTAPSIKALMWIGGIAILPWTLAMCFAGQRGGWGFFAFAVALALPLGVAFLLRGKSAWINGVAAAWVMVLSMIPKDMSSPWPYLWFGLGAAGFVAWGMAERRTERVNLGMACFAITILCFYFSSVMDKLGRSASLIGLGVLFLAGGWALEKLRRRFVRQIV